MGLYRIIQKDTQFGLAPMAGVAIPLNKDTNFNIGAIYNWALETKKSASGYFRWVQPGNWLALLLVI